MKGFDYIYENTLMRVLIAANRLGIKKDDVVCITKEGGNVCLVYWKDFNNDDE